MARRRPPPWLVEADDDSFDAAWPARCRCWSICRRRGASPVDCVGPTVEQAAADFAGRLKVVKVNIDHAPAVAQRFGVLSVPTLVVVHHGREVARRVGALPAAALNDWLGGVLQAAA